MVQSKPVHIAQYSQSRLLYSEIHFTANSSNQKGAFKMISGQRPLGLMRWEIRVLWLCLKKLPTYNVITSLSYRAEPLYDSKHISFKKRKCLTFAYTHYKAGKSSSQGKNKSLSFPIALLFWQQRPLTLANNEEYLTCRFSCENVTKICLRLRTTPNPDYNNIWCLGKQSDGQTNYPFP